MNKIIEYIQKNLVKVLISAALIVGLILSLCIKFYSSEYLFKAQSYSVFTLLGASPQLIIAVVVVCVIVLCLLGTVCLFELRKNKVARTIGSVLGIITIIASLGLFFLAVARIWMTPFSFSNIAYEKFEVGYYLYLASTFLTSIYACYVTAIYSNNEVKM